MCRADGLGTMHDRELQSAIHERQHHFDGAPDMSVDQQIAFIKGLRQQIENHPGIPSREKYRISQNQPGMITRLDEELQRLQTGEITDGHGRTRPMEDKHRNKGNQLQAIQYLGTMVPRIQQAKASYFELNARHTGRSVDEVRAEWDGIMDRPGEGRGNVGISLRDDWRDQLAVAGLSAQAQADIGQSRRAREALAEMESRRLATLAAQPQRATIRDEHRHAYASSGVQCDHCGQFGHEKPACPNTALVAQRQQLEAEHRVATNRLRIAELQNLIRNEGGRDGFSDDERAKLEDEISQLRQLRFGNDPSDPNGIKGCLTCKGQREVPNPDGGGTITCPACVERRRLRHELQRSDDVGTVAAAEATLKYIANKDDDLQQQIARSAPKVSSWVAEVAYNEESGLMTVTTQPRRRKDGNTVQPVTYPYRVSPEEARRILEHPEIGVALNESVMRKGKGHTNDGFHWENRADAAAAMKQHKCPTCGRWASMTSSHACRVPGSAVHANETADRAELAQWRRATRDAQANGVEPPQKPLPRVPVAASQYKKLADGGVVHLPRRDTVLALTNKGKVAAAAVSVKHPDATVSGQTTVWQDPDGRRLISPLKEAGGTGLRCTCDEYEASGRCPHIKAATLAVAKNWGAHPIAHPEVRPGRALADLHRDRTSDVAFDAPKGTVERLDYGRIRKYRTERIGTHVAGLFESQRSGRPINGPTVRPPVDKEGNPVPWPETFQRTNNVGGGTSIPVDLNDTEDVQYRLRAALFSQTRTHFSVTRDPDGGMRITVPRARRTKDGKISAGERQRLCDALNIPASQSRADGVYIPADTSWRHEMLSRAYGDTPTIRASRFTIA